MSVSITKNDIVEAVAGTTNEERAAESILEKQWEAWGFKEQDFGERDLIPLSAKFAQGNPEAAQWPAKTGVSDQYREKLAKAASDGAVLGSAGVVKGYEPGNNKAVDDAVEKAGPIDRGVVEQATPIQFDPRIVDIQRSQAPIITDIMQRGQAGFTAKYNVVSDRSEPLGFLSESESLDLSGMQDSDHTLGTEEKDMEIWVDKVNLADFTVRAEASLGYMDVAQMTFGQRVIAHALQKARAFFYGDSSVGSGSNNIEDGSAYDGMAKMAVDASNNTDKSGFSSSSDNPYLTDLKRELTKEVKDSALTYANARIGVSPDFFDVLENEANPSTRIDSFSEGVNFGGRALSIKGVPVREYPNIRGYPSLTSTNFTSNVGDVFLWDATTVQYRNLMPLTTVPLARVGLGNRAAMAEFGTLLDKSQGAHLHYFSSYPTPA